MDFGAIKMLVEVIREKGFRGISFRDIYSRVNKKWYRISWRKFDQLKNIDQKFYSSDYNDASANKYGVKCRTSLRFCENKGWVNKIDFYGSFQLHFPYWLGRKSSDDARQINRWILIKIRFRCNLVKMILDAGSKFGDSSISPTIRQILCTGVMN